MKKFLTLIILAIFALAACSNESMQTTDYTNATWNDILADGTGTSVRMFMWGGDEGINQYMDEVIAPKLKEEYDIEFERVPMDTQNILQKLVTEKEAEKKEGTIDIIWINGENFKNAKEQSLLYGPFTDLLPNMNEYVDKQSLDIQYDFGTKTEGFEAPWGKVQFVFLYDEANVPEPPQSFGELLKWTNENKGKFTYPEASDFTGNAFLRHLLYHSVDVESLLEKGYDEAFVQKNTEEMWSYLNEIKSNLWREGQTYPKDLTELDRLYSRGEVWMTMGYNEARAESLINEGVFPKTTKSFVLDTGSIGNTHFLAIPFNSPNKAGAMVVINHLLSPDAQLAKYEPTYWGDRFSLDLSKLPAEMQAKFNEVDRGDSVIEADQLQGKVLPEVDAEYVNWLKETWYEKVVQGK
ncbi:ABC transporter substrate-binding protein [Bacillus kexueae]|uniref:ABC transporter substrate-binding protein n=1 Tax=Aeribacillus kexueae TaxID=2078952 RepID=UPI001FAF54B2|nr:ABC transporter substrate-binding protein [Bacillus kexueae]